jgi:maltose-binding protein MalE
MLNPIRGGHALALVLALALCSFITQAQSSGSNRGDQAEGKKVSVTGCLQKGDEPGEFSITGSDGRTYGLRSTAVNLAAHLGHKVTVTGVTSREEKEENEKKEAKGQGEREYADLNVTNLKMVSQTCQ